MDRQQRVTINYKKNFKKNVYILLTSIYQCDTNYYTSIEEKLTCQHDSTQEQSVAANSRRWRGTRLGNTRG